MQRRIYAIHGETNGNVEIPIQQQEFRHAQRPYLRGMHLAIRFKRHATRATIPPTPGIPRFSTNLVGGLCMR